ncbi:nitrate reductase molybdenum cofactor assembly chaperone [Candidatus Schmidhempelia bombi]|uniref:Nitrate reductase molybdenum cofactor assembly chaperone n=1 Tax=Candidatus Schmidhempelia bombi str. Bimp TaxID=1387197 RepID=A0AB94IEG8_9GAMM|nr:nitrate reductase molybdenum cofactor assembly chaperone [Candidatus Schmidhempelia bombi]TEA27886.1 nitrate reductase molybdenum cofactor assembly chaperone [Candidatus Schmidhempelia bombi str. Bimp]
MQSLRVISYLLDYPDDELWANKQPLINAVSQSTLLTAEQKHQLNQFIEGYLTGDLLDVQETYIYAFDTSHSTSLLLFEHIHGDSRERGQAMVDLLAHYEQAGLALTSKQLPDYLPLFLDFLALQSQTTARFWLDQIAAVLRLLALRLAKQQSIYHLLLDLLYQLSGHQLDETSLQQQVAQENIDHSPQALDKIWQEEQVLFNAGSACDSILSPSTLSPAQTPTYYVEVGEDKRSQV